MIDEVELNTGMMIDQMSVRGRLRGCGCRVQGIGQCLTFFFAENVHAGLKDRRNRLQRGKREMRDERGQLTLT